MTAEEDVSRRLSRFLAVTAVMLVSAMTALGHVAVSLKARVDARAHASHR